ncbi:MAG: tRNA pseudouridine(38-40) synthase TruA [Chlamydiae bacterium]|nr:tRNA pseudouridine(38-40) synthase TruA [Chlamydiota bacterium]
MTHLYKMTLSYDGTNYCGWQIQKDRKSIQHLIQDFLKMILSEDIELIGASRTDAGVHALEQVAHFLTSKEIDASRIVYSLNGLLAKDIRINKIEREKPSFHARYSAIGKIYHYNICLSYYQNPINRFYSLHVRRKLDMELLKTAAKFFIGTHDFTSFANKSDEGAAKRNPIKTIKRIDIIETIDGIRLEFEGDGFLYKMIRNIVGTILDIASKKIALENLNKILLAKDRKLAGKTAPALGLFLVKVIYDNKSDGNSSKDLK